MQTTTQTTGNRDANHHTNHRKPPCKPPHKPQQATMQTTTQTTVNHHANHHTNHTSTAGPLPVTRRDGKIGTKVAFAKRTRHGLNYYVKIFCLVSKASWPIRPCKICVLRSCRGGKITKKNAFAKRARHVLSYWSRKPRGPSGRACVLRSSFVDSLAGQCSIKIYLIIKYVITIL